MLTKKKTGLVDELDVKEERNTKDKIEIEI